MNERIQELAKQAGFDAVSLVAFNIKEDLEKFAELIVRECVDYYRSQVGETSEPHTRTLEHFGVE
jgi:alkanesulfonate monooxygenase SsuD/methylene tetrahydromethanopterin reductase-like flavin-dependent oxidoreductase (luciferase family)